MYRTLSSLVTQHLHQINYESMSSHSYCKFKDFLAAINAKPYSSAVSLPGAFYTDPDWARQEQQTLFAQQWVCIGRTAEVEHAGDYLACEVAGEPVAIVHGKDGKIRALSNVCRHRGTILLSGSGQNNQIVCPYHHWAYDHTGKLTSAPHMDQHDTFKPSSCRLPEFACDEWQGFLFVCLAENPPPLRTNLQPLEALIKDYHLEQMHLNYCTEETWNINWKSLVENYMEGYHLSPLHRTTLHKVNPTRLCQHIPAGDRYFAYQVGFASRVAEERIGHNDLSTQQMDTCIMFALPPALTVGIGSDYSSFLCLRPNGANKVVVKMGLIFHGTDWTATQVDTAINLFHDTMNEDHDVLLRVHKGQQSAFFHGGPLAPPALEGTVWDFYQYLSRSFANQT